MRMRMVMAMGLIACASAVGGCGDSTTTAPPTTSSSAKDRIRDDLRAAGSDIKDAASTAAAEAKPALERAKEDTRSVIHGAAERVANSTATQPAPQ